MLNIKFLTTGNLKEAYWRDALNEYSKRLGGLCRFTCTEFKEVRLSDNPSQAEIDAALEAEGEKILAEFTPRAYKIALCVEGKQLKSEDFAALFDSVATNGYGEISFIIGGSFGLSERVKAACDKRLSVSLMTFPHRMMRVILLEQVYRAYNILGGGKYHK
jgi:23S rRNA (pseudouridine1915-N3)-methyltransferase